MHIDFGWTADAAAWTDTRRSATGSVRLGPCGLVRLLQTRLALSHPPVDPAQRIAQYLSAIDRARPAWCAASFGVDPWATARSLLGRRDALVEAGSDLAPAEQELPDRLSALVAIEAALQGPLTLSPGPADDLADVLDALDGDGAGWPLGIDTLMADESPEDLPGRWGPLLRALERAGVDVQVREHAPARAPEMTIVRAAEEWSAAETAARYLRGAVARAAGPVQVLATEDTITLDAALHRRGLPAVGRATASTDRARHQLLPLFLALAVAPVDVRQLAAFLDLRLVAAEPEPYGVVPARVRRALLAALSAEPGVDGPAWRHAVGEDEAARAIDTLVTAPIPTSDVRPSRLLRALPWLQERLRAIGHADSDLAETTAQVATFTSVLEMLPDEPLSPRTLQQIVDSCGGRGASPFAQAEAGPLTITSRPAHLRAEGATVLWWGATEARAARPVEWDADELALLHAAGASPADPQRTAALETSAHLRGLATAARLIVVHPDRRIEEDQPLSSLLSHLASERGEVDEVLQQASRAPEDLVDQGVWSLGGVRLELTPVPVGVPEPKDDLTRRLDGPAPQLAPTQLSYSQAETLVGCHQKWTYRYGLGLRPGSVRTVPQGNQMIGLLVHSVVEQLVHDHENAPEAPWPPDGDAVREVLEELIPRFASELDLPGRAAERSRIIARTVRSLGEFFSRMQAAGLVITGTETRFEKAFALPDGQVVPFVGARDVDARGADGRPAVIDLKWTDSATKYPKLYDSGEAIQLASYAWSLTDEPTGVGDPPARLGYFLLQQGDFVAEDRTLDGRRRETFAVQDAWTRLTHEVGEAVRAVTGGEITARSGQELLDAGLDGSSPWKDKQRVYEQVQEDAREQGGVWVDARCDYCDFALLCGLTGDRS